MRNGKSIHGRRMHREMFPSSFLKNCTDRYCYMLPDCVKGSMPITQKNRELLIKLGELMGIDESSIPRKQSNIPAGYTYLGQFIDHDITLEPFSNIDENKKVDPQETMNLRTPCLDLDSLYGGGPVVTPYLYDHSPGVDGLKFIIGENNTSTGRGGPPRADGSFGTPLNFDLPRTPDGTAIIGDPRNDENLIISQLHHSFLKFHNRVVDQVISDNPNLGRQEIFSKARELVTHHYQWIVVNDFLRRILPDKILKDVFNRRRVLLFKKKKGKNGNTDPFRLPVEFTVGAYRFGHSMVRDNYDFNDNFRDGAGPNDFLKAFEFVSRGRIPVFSNWVVDFNRFFITNRKIGKVNMAMKIDTNMALNLHRLPSDLNELPPTGMMMNFKAMLASRNLVRGMIFKLPTGQCVARKCKMKAMTSFKDLFGKRMLLSIAARIPKPLLPGGVRFPKLPGGIKIPSRVADKDLKFLIDNKELRTKTPLWYYVLREAELKGKGNQLGPCGARILAETFFRMLDEDPKSYLNKNPRFKPSLPRIAGKKRGDFDMADLLNFAGVLTL